MSLLSWLYSLGSGSADSFDFNQILNGFASSGLFRSTLSSAGVAPPLSLLSSMASDVYSGASSDPAGVSSMLGSSSDLHSASSFDPYAVQISNGSNCPFSGFMNTPTGVLYGVDAINKAMNGSNDSSAADTSFDWAKWFSQLGQTAEEAARLQAQRNEDAAVDAYLRSEIAADNAMNRARELRQTYYQDYVASLTAAGLNPVLAASGGLGGVSASAPQANAPASTSSSAGGLNAANLLTAIATMISAAGNLLKGLNPTQIVKNFFS